MTAIVAVGFVGVLVVIGLRLVIAKGNRAVDAAIAQAGLPGAPQWQADFSDPGRDAEVLDAIGADDPELAELLKRIDTEIARGES